MVTNSDHYNSTRDGNYHHTRYYLKKKKKDEIIDFFNSNVEYILLLTQTNVDY